MNNWTPGDGWRSLEYIGDQELPRDTVAYLKPGGGWAYWVREGPVPPLPTEPGYYVDVDGCAWRLDTDGEWDDTFGNPITEGQIHPPLERLELRRETAKAVLDRVLKLDSWNDGVSIKQIKGLYDEFGVEP